MWSTGPGGGARLGRQRRRLGRRQRELGRDTGETEKTGVCVEEGDGRRDKVVVDPLVHLFLLHADGRVSLAATLANLRRQ